MAAGQDRFKCARFPTGLARRPFAFLPLRFHANSEREGSCQPWLPHFVPIHLALSWIGPVRLSNNLRQSSPPKPQQHLGIFILSFVLSSPLTSYLLPLTSRLSPLRPTTPRSFCRSTAFTLFQTSVLLEVQQLLSLLPVTCCIASTHSPIHNLPLSNASSVDRIIPTAVLPM